MGGASLEENAAVAANVLQNVAPAAVVNNIEQNADVPKRRRSKRRRSKRRRSKRRPKRRRSRRRKQRGGKMPGIMSPLGWKFFFTTARDFVPTQVKDTLRASWGDAKNVRHKYLGDNTQFTADPMEQPIANNEVNDGYIDHHKQSTKQQPPTVSSGSPPSLTVGQPAPPPSLTVGQPAPPPSLTVGQPAPPPSSGTSNAWAGSTK